MNQGWIHLWREILTSKLLIKPYSYFEAWIWLILGANWKDGICNWNNHLISVKRGQVLTSQLKLSKAWGWSRSKVECFLKKLQQLQDIYLETTPNYSRITICKYAGYNDEPATHSKLTVNQQATNSKLIGTIEEGKEGKEGKEDKSKDLPPKEKTGGKLDISKSESKEKKQSVRTEKQKTLDDKLEIIRLEAIKRLGVKPEDKSVYPALNMLLTDCKEWTYAVGGIWQFSHNGTSGHNLDNYIAWVKTCIKSKPEQWKTYFADGFKSYEKERPKLLGEILGGGNA